jgi:hypothetical protein
MAKTGPVTREIAESLAIAALGFLAQDHERLGRFLSVTGMGPEMIRKAAADPSFLAGVLDHIVSDEPLLVAFAQQASIDPRTVERAQALLVGEAPEVP